MANRRSRRDFTREEVLQFLNYDPHTGAFIWIRDVGRVAAGMAAGGAKDGYLQIPMFRRFYRAHHLAWLIMTGEWPPSDMDVEHIDRVRSNNAWDNLRLATRSQNNMNMGMRSDNVSGYPGVGFHKASGRWYARVTVDRRVISLQSYKTKEEAIAARQDGERKYFGEFAPNHSEAA